MSKSSEAFADEFEQASTIRQDVTPGERGGGSVRAARMAAAWERYKRGEALSFEEFKAKHGD